MPADLKTASDMMMIELDRSVQTPLENISVVSTATDNILSFRIVMRHRSICRGTLQMLVDI